MLFADLTLNMYCNIRVMSLLLLLTSNWTVAQASEIYGAGTATAATLMAELTNGYEFFTDNVCKCSSNHPPNHPPTGRVHVV